MDYKENILGLIGQTPLVKLNKLTKGIQATVLAKMESLNPGGSVKDRIGISMIDAAEREERIKPGGTVVEATSGNTGIGLALVKRIAERLGGTVGLESELGKGSSFWIEIPAA